MPFRVAGMKSIVDGIAVEYMDEGAGHPLLLIHGWGDTMHTFDRLVPELKERYRVVRLDLPGFGGTELPHEPWDVERYARFVQHFLQKVNVQPKAIVGHSLGGRVAIKGFALRLFTAEKVVLIAAAGNARRRTMRNAVLFVTAKLGRVLTAVWPLTYFRDSLRKKLYEKVESDYPNTKEMKETFLNVIREDLSGDAAQLSLPTLLIWGTADTTTPLSDGERFASVIKNSKLSVIPRAGHFVHMEKPLDVMRALEAFV